MKITCLVVAALCACAHAGVVQNEVDHVEAHLDEQEFHLKVSSPDTVINDDDQLLSTELTDLERAQSRNVVADAIRNLLESFRTIVINGNDALPPLDPLLIPQIGPLSVSTTGIRVTADLFNFNAVGLRWYVIDNVTFNTLRLALGVKVTVPNLTFTGTYDARALITLLTHQAGGNFRVFVNRIEVGVDARLGTNILGGGHLVLRELDVRVVIHDINIRIDGMVGSNILNNLINSMVQNAAQNILRDDLDTISRIISEAFFDVINEVLGNFTLDDLLG